jgi:hypothetical protein
MPSTVLNEAFMLEKVLLLEAPSKKMPRALPDAVMPVRVLLELVAR